MSKKILVIEDRPTHLMMITDKLISQGYEVVTAANAKEAKEKIKNQQIKLITLDLKIPPEEGKKADKEEGFKLLEFFKDNDNTKSIPIIVMSIFGGEVEYIDRCFKLGANKVIRKPFDIDELVKGIREILD